MDWSSLKSLVLTERRSILEILIPPHPHSSQLLQEEPKIYLTHIVALCEQPQVSVYPYEKQPENPNSYRARKREAFRLQRERKKARKEGFVGQPQLVLASAADTTTDNNPVCWSFEVAYIESCTFGLNVFMIWIGKPSSWGFSQLVIILSNLFILSNYYLNLICPSNCFYVREIV